MRVHMQLLYLSGKIRIIMPKKQQTPLMRQYDEIKASHPDTILLFRVGDFYETFGDDAVLVSKELGITLTKRNNGGDQTPLAGFPFHAIDTYLPKLIKGGHKVAVCEQTQTPEEAKAQKTIVKREVTEIVTPGVALSDQLLEHKRNNYLLSIHQSGSTLGLAFSDVSTGEFALSQMAFNELPAFLSSLQPSEILVNKGAVQGLLECLSDRALSKMEDWIYEGEYGYELLVEHFKTHSLKGFGVEDLKIAQVAAGALLHYVRETQKTTLGHLRRLYAFENDEFMALDGATKRNLELTAGMNTGGAEGSLISILDQTQTAMGARLLRKWIMRPLKRLGHIHQRLNAVDILHQRNDIRQDIREELAEVGDLERLISRICIGRTTPRDVMQVKLSLMQLPKIKSLLATLAEPMLGDLNKNLHLLVEVQERIGKALQPDPPASLRDGGYIAEGFSADLDELREIALNGKNYIARIQKKLVEETRIGSLKLGFNKVFGYYIEVTNVHKNKIPETFIRKQTLVNSERYITPELKEVEEKILSAEDKMVSLEQQLFQELRLYVSEFADQIQEIAGALAQVDCLQSLAQVARSHGYNKPKVTDSGIVDIKGGRHPVVERTLPLGEPFIPNDVFLDNESEQIMMITGPNMAGKSIILRQTGLIVLLAQIGSFVPAEAAEIGLVDKIFTRVGASDNLAAGESTFLVEMNEAANILNNATPRSLILLDEVGRGTSTFDGLSIAWSLAEYLHNQPQVAAKTLFATHYHELNELERLYERIVNYNVQVKEHNGKVIFLRTLIRGGADHSYGIQVASMAGLPQIVINRAREILDNLEAHSAQITQENGSFVEGAGNKKKAQKSALKTVNAQNPIPQLSLFNASIDPALEQVKTRLQSADINRMTPIEALLFLTDIKGLLQK